MLMEMLLAEERLCNRIRVNDEKSGPVYNANTFGEANLAEQPREYFSSYVTFQFYMAHHFSRGSPSTSSHSCRNFFLSLKGCTV